MGGIMAIYTKIDQDVCISCGACVAEAPSIYDMADTAFSMLDSNVGNTEVPASDVDDVMSAKESCPVDAVLVEETPFS
jgi:ferredoxin